MHITFDNLLFQLPRWRADMKIDVLTAIDEIATQPRSIREEIAAYVVARSIMKFPSKPQYWLLILVTWSLRKLKGEAAVFHVWKNMVSTRPDILEGVLDGMYLHMYEGKDAFESTSIGGFSQRELDELADVLNLLEKENTYV